MSHKTLLALSIALALPVLFLCSGCVHTAFGPNAGLIGIPIPMSPYFQQKLEENFWVQERYNRVPILGPITSGGPPMALDPPSDDEIMRQLEVANPVEGGVPFLHEMQRNNVRMVKDLIADYADPPRVYPLVGPAQLHHAHYKCTIYYTETTRTGWPIPYTTVDEDTQQVIYVDHDHLHMVGNVDCGASSNY